LIGAFTFSAISYSRLSSGLDGFIDAQRFFVCLLNTISIFFLLRIFDEHKDAEDDAQYRQHLPVPRGLIALRELRFVAYVVIAIQLLVDVLYYPKMLLPWFLVMLYMSIMGKEFFVSEWLKKHQFWYIVSHMLIIPFVDVFASGFDWYLDERQAPVGLLFFFGVSFMNGIVLEVGRKLRAPHDEKEGVVTYSALLGPQKATFLWMAMIVATCITACTACYFASFPKYEYLILAAACLMGLWFAWRYLKLRDSKSAKTMENISGIWTILMYLTLGGLPMIIQMLSK
jgi:4-hydroxybenzoate polyprenyltransferase